MSCPLALPWRRLYVLLQLLTLLPHNLPSIPFCLQFESRANHVPDSHGMAATNASARMRKRDYSSFLAVQL